MLRRHHKPVHWDNIFARFQKAGEKRRNKALFIGKFFLP